LYTVLFTGLLKYCRKRYFDNGPAHDLDKRACH